MAKPSPTYPDFLLIGAPQAGADLVKAALQTHPSVWFPPLDNILAFHPSFQLARFDTIMKFYRRELEVAFSREQAVWLLRYFLRIAPSPSWYSSLFRTPAPGLIKGELSDEYMTLPYDEAAKLRSVMPKAKIILMIRDPIERSYADIRAKFVNHPKLPFSKLSKRQLIALMNSDWARTHSGYQNAINNWNVFFPQTQIFIGFYDELLSQPDMFFSKLYAFLGLGEAPAFQPTASTPVAFPAALYKYLHPFYIQEIKQMAKRFGGPAASWLEGYEYEIPSAPRISVGRTAFRAAS
jgi:hypothetical protein